MTREEARLTLQENLGYLSFEHPGRITEAIKVALETLSEPSLPSNLDEAAEEYAFTNWEDNDYHKGASEGVPFDPIGYTEKVFKAGAEWMAGHGGYEAGYKQVVEDVDRMMDEKLKAAGFVIADGKIVRAKTK